ncbi:MAG: hypothetical protein LBP85_06315 [Prevotellaceae bacterium]|nr:hypothetical protein [Prevotellaceae bacterium]
MQHNSEAGSNRSLIPAKAGIPSISEAVLKLRFRHCFLLRYARSSQWLVKYHFETAPAIPVF